MSHPRGLKISFKPRESRQMVPSVFSAFESIPSWYNRSCRAGYANINPKGMTMLINAKTLTHYTLEARDGEIGRCADFLYDPDFWTVRYMVADTGKWLTGRRVLIAPVSLGNLDLEQESKRLPVNLTRNQIQNSPPLEEQAPVTRRMESRLNMFYEWPIYWTGIGLADSGYTGAIIEERAEERESAASEHKQYVRSIEETIGYRVSAADGDIGHVDDFILNSHDWTIRYLVVDTRNWIPGRKVILSPSWVSEIKLDVQSTRVTHTIADIKASPLFHPGEPITPEYEERLHSHYKQSTEPHHAGHSKGSR